MTRRTYLLGLFLALVLLLALRLPLLRCGPLEADVIKHYDEINYVWLANSLMNGDTEADTRWAWTRSPGPALVLLPFMALRDVPAELVICEYQIVQTILWAGMLFALAWMARVLFDRRTALISALLLAVLPLAGFVTLIVYSDTLFCAGLVAACAALLQYSRRPHWGWLVFAGVAAGWGALARSTILPLLPVLALWVVAARWRMGNRQGRMENGEWGMGNSPKLPSGPRHSTFNIQNPKLASLLAGMLFVTCCALTIAPWTIRNYVAHGGLIIIDTTGTHNLWADNKTSDITVSSTVWAYSDNPVERQQFAMRRAREDITSDPARFARKVADNIAESWRPMELDSSWGRWFKMQQNTQTFSSALIGQLNTTLSVVLPLALLGLMFAPSRATGARDYRLVVIALALCFSLITGITHYEDRYRLPFMLLLLPYAAWCLAHPRQLFAALRRPLGWAALALVLLLGVHYAHYVWPEQWHNARALTLHSRGLLRESTGDAAGALADYQAAAALQPRLQESTIAAARIEAAQGDLDQAEALLREAPKASKLTPDIIVPLQQVLLAQDRTDEVLALDNQLTIPGRTRAEDLAWDQVLSPGRTLDLGVNDLGLVRGFYVREQGEEGFFRWSRPEAEVRLAGAGDYVCLRLNAARPPDVPAPVVTLATDGSTSSPQGTGDLGQIYPPRTGWAWGCVAAPPEHVAGPLDISLRTTAFNPHAHSGNRDTRNLGIVVDQVALRDGPLPVDPATGLLFDQRPTTAATAEALTLLGINGALDIEPGETLNLTLWWRSAEPPPASAFTFLHLLDASGTRVAEYNAPLAGGQFPAPWVASEPLADPVALPLPADLPPGPYRLVAGVFDPASGIEIGRWELGDGR